MTANSNINIKAMEFHYPFTKIEELEPLIYKGVVFIPYIALDKQDKFESITDYYEFLLESTPENTRFWFAFCKNPNSVIKFVEKYQ